MGRQMRLKQSEITGATEAAKTSHHESAIKRVTRRGSDTRRWLSACTSQSNETGLQRDRKHLQALL